MTTSYYLNGPGALSLLLQTWADEWIESDMSESTADFLRRKADEMEPSRYSIDDLDDVPTISTDVDAAAQWAARDLFGSDTTVGIYDRVAERIIAYVHESDARDFIKVLDDTNPDWNDTHDNDDG